VDGGRRGAKNRARSRAGGRTDNCGTNSLVAQADRQNGKPSIRSVLADDGDFISKFQSLFGFNFGQNADLDIILDGQDDRKMAEIKDENGRKERHYLFFDGESVTGRVRLHFCISFPLRHNDSSSPIN
jgi:hypothetical protein